MILILLALKKTAFTFRFESTKSSRYRADITFYIVCIDIVYVSLCFFVIKELFVTSISFYKKKKTKKKNNTWTMLSTHTKKVKADFSTK